VPAWLNPALISMALCWRLDRRDGIALGFTTHDRDLTISGLIYRAAPGMLPSAISVSDGFDVDTLDVSGALTDDAISARDLADGRWDGARVRIFASSWEAPGADVLPLARGELGDVGMQGAGFTAEMRGPTAMLERPVVDQTSPECRAELGDRRCRVDMAGRRRQLTIVEVVDEVTLRLSGSEPSTNAYAYGGLRWGDGANCGLVAAILSSAGAILVLRDAPPHRAAIGGRVEVSEGCDKGFATCRLRFNNAANFRGEPHLPGNDLLTRYPGA
jgi:uncharacterized phage protein (TIGR02218 family)